MKVVVSLADIGKNDVFLAGGKGAQLGELKKAGFNVPEGFVITTNVYNALLRKLQAPIDDILTKLDVENTKLLEDASSEIQALIIFASLPEDVMEAITSSYKKLGGLIAVRSSATAEDQKEASFAGQMATFLNVAESNLITSIKRCLASLFTARAIYYRTQKKIGHTSVLMAVIVQKMVSSKTAGVAFSVNPVSGNEEEILIEATAGLGEAVVAGQTIPDNYVVDKKTRNVKSSSIRNNSPVLAEHEIKQIATVLKKIEAHYELPQDIEWAIGKEHKLYLLQARPITTLQVKKRPVWKKIIAREYGVQYTELSIKCLSPLNKHLVPQPFYEQVYIPEDGNEACYVDEAKWNSFVSALKGKYVENPDNYEEFERMFIKSGTEYMETAKAIAKTDLKHKSNAELKKLYFDYLKKNCTYGPFIWMQFLINNFFAEKAKAIIAEKLGKDAENLQEYLEVAFQPEKKAASLQLSEIASKWYAMGKEERDAAYENLKWVPCLDIHNRPWTKEEFFSHIREFKKVGKKQVTTYESLVTKIKPSGKEKRVLDIAKRLSYLKDLKDDFRRQGILYGQKLFEEIARRAGINLESISYVTEEEIADFLDNGQKIPEKLTAGRKKGFAIYFNHEKKVECKSGKDAEQAVNGLGIIIFEKFSEEIKGTPASPGKAKGIVTIIKGVADLNKVRKGDILVAVTTHPDYVPAMQRAAAIITDEGGVTSHAAIIAREFSLPCIVGAHHASKSLKDGDKVEVDADSGFVRKMKK